MHECVFEYVINIKQYSTLNSIFLVIKRVKYNNYTQQVLGNIVCSASLCYSVDGMPQELPVLMSSSLWCGWYRHELFCWKSQGLRQREVGAAVGPFTSSPWEQGVLGCPGARSFTHSWRAGSKASAPIWRPGRGSCPSGPSWEPSPDYRTAVCPGYTSYKWSLQDIDRVRAAVVLEQTCV